MGRSLPTYVYIRHCILKGRLDCTRLAMDNLLGRAIIWPTQSNQWDWTDPFEALQLINLQNQESQVITVGAEAHGEHEGNPAAILEELPMGNHSISRQHTSSSDLSSPSIIPTNSFQSHEMQLDVVTSRPKRLNAAKVI